MSKGIFGLWCVHSVQLIIEMVCTHYRLSLQRLIKNNRYILPGLSQVSEINAYLGFCLFFQFSHFLLTS